MFTVLQIILAFIIVVLIVAVVLQIVYIRVELSKYALKDHSKQAIANSRVNDLIDRQNNFNMYAIQVDMYLCTMLNNGDFLDNVKALVPLPEIPISLRIFENPVNKSITPDDFYLLALRRSQSTRELFASIENKKVNFLNIAGFTFHVDIMNNLYDYIKSSYPNLTESFDNCVVIFLGFTPTYENMLPSEYKGKVAGGPIITSFFGCETETVVTFNPVQPRNKGKSLVESIIESNQVLHVIGYRV